jgi:hypothetical protein
MITQQDLIAIEAAGNVQAAREVAMQVMFAGMCDDRRAQIRAKLVTLGTKEQIVQMGWDLLLNGQGFRNPATVKAYRGVAYKK